MVKLMVKLIKDSTNEEHVKKIQKRIDDFKSTLEGDNEINYFPKMYLEIISIISSLMGLIKNENNSSHMHSYNLLYQELKVLSDDLGHKHKSKKNDQPENEIQASSNNDILEVFI